VPCTESTGRPAHAIALGLVTLLALLAGGCAGLGPAPGPATAPPAAAPAPTASPAAPAGAGTSAASPSPGPGATRPSAVPLPPPVATRNWTEFKMQAAQRMVAANPAAAYTGKPQDVLLAIPVLEVELNGNGTIRRIDVLRRPGQAPETIQMAIDAVRRAEPFGDVSRLPRPWRFTEAFLFNDDRRFKPRTLDL
jgi:hypothetical protein